MSDRVLLAMGTQRMQEWACLCGRGAIGCFVRHMQKASLLVFLGVHALFIRISIAFFVIVLLQEIIGTAPLVSAKI